MFCVAAGTECDGGLPTSLLLVDLLLVDLLLVEILLVKILLVVIRITISGLVHDGQRTTFGCTADHLLLDPCRNGSGLLSLCLGCLNCSFLLRRNDTSWIEKQREGSMSAF